uniref:Uncharacterized protein n=1 Tax=Trichobilharzia regenti TaxID=157069 RepID=A0AA85J0G3_TRIRE|nr:unnamed protein product [Trichobilharzia regenti]
MNPVLIGLLLFLSLSSSPIILSADAKVTQIDAPLGFSKNYEMFIKVEGIKFTLDDDQLVMKDADCTTTVDLSEPDHFEIQDKKAIREVTKICASWFTKGKKKARVL